MAMQFVVPQFIEAESKVIGPISVRQFIILLVTFGIIYIEFELFSFVVFAIIALFTFAFGAVLAFAKVNSQPFHTFILSLIQTLKRPSLAIWHHETTMKTVEKKGRKDKKDKKKNAPFVPKTNVSTSNLAELSLIADTSGRYTPDDLKQLQSESGVPMPKQEKELGTSDQEINPPQ